MSAMRMYLARHADAVAEDAELADWQRFLTPEGRRQASALGRALAEQGFPLAAVLTSPLVRAVQTAELASAALGFAGSVEVLPALAPGGDVYAAAAMIRERGLAGAGTILAVGHEPGLSGLAGALSGGLPLPGLRKAQAGCIEDMEARFTIRWDAPRPAPWR